MNIITNKLEDSKACSEYAKYASKGYETIDLLQDNILVKLHLKWSNQQIQSTPKIFFFNSSSCLVRQSK